MKKRNFKNKIISGVLALCMAVFLFPTSVFAAGSGVFLAYTELDDGAYYIFAEDGTYTIGTAENYNVYLSGSELFLSGVSISMNYPDGSLTGVLTTNKSLEVVLTGTNSLIITIEISDRNAIKANGDITFSGGGALLLQGAGGGINATGMVTVYDVTTVTSTGSAENGMTASKVFVQDKSVLNSVGTLNAPTIWVSSGATLSGSSSSSYGINGAVTMEEGTVTASSTVVNAFSEKPILNPSLGCLATVTAGENQGAAQVIATEVHKDDLPADYHENKYVNIVMAIPVVATPTFNPASGTVFDVSQSVEIASATPEAEIYYTTNGDTPTTSSTLYSGAFNVTETATVKAIAVKSNMNDSAVAEATFTENPYSVTNNLTNITTNNSATTYTATANYTATLSASANYALPQTISVTIGGTPLTLDTDGTLTSGEYSYNSTSGAIEIHKDGVTGAIAITATALEANNLASVTQADVTYGTAVNPQVAYSGTQNGNDVVYTYSTTENGTYSATVPTDVGTYWVKASSIGHATVTDKSVTSSFTISKATANRPSAPTHSVWADTHITVVAVAGQEYSIDDGKNWQDGGEFTGLTEGTEYSIITRVKETDTHKASANSGKLTMTTKYTERTITFDANGGTVSPTEVKTINRQLVNLPTPERNGYNFLAWHTQLTGGTEVALRDVFTADTTVYAIWDVAPLTGTATIDDTTPAIGNTLTASLTNTNNTGTLSYQWKSGTTIVGTNSDTYTVVASDAGNAITVTITSSAQTGSITSVATDSAKVDRNLSFAKSTETKTVGNAKFTNGLSGGKIDDVSYTSGNTKVATVDKTSGEVTIVGAGTAVITAKAEVTSTHNADTVSYTLTVNAGTITAGSDETTVFEGDFAKLESVKITVGGTTTTLSQVGNKLTGYSGYEFNGGVVGEVNPGSIEVTLYKEFLATLPAGGYSLAITTIDGGESGTITGTIPAKTTHSVTVDANGGTGATANTTAQTGDIVTVSAGTKAGYTFSGWTVTKGGVIVVDNQFVMLNEDVELIANWFETPSPSNTKYNLVINYGSGDGDYTAGTWITIKAENRAGYTFSHWASNEVTFENARAETTRFIMNNKNVEVTAVYVLNDGVITSEKEDVKPEETAKPDDSTEETAPVETVKPVETEQPVLGGDSENEPASADGENSVLPIIGIGAVIIAIAGFMIIRKGKSE